MPKKTDKSDSTSTVTETVEIKPDNTPVEMAISLHRNSGGWSVTMYSIQGDKVISKDTSNPDLKTIAVEQFKIAAARNFIMKD